MKDISEWRDDMGIYERIVECNRVGSISGLPHNEFEFVVYAYELLVNTGRHVPGKGTKSGAVEAKYTPEELEVLYARWRVEQNE